MSDFNKNGIDSFDEFDSFDDDEELLAEIEDEETEADEATEEEETSSVSGSDFDSELFDSFEDDETDDELAEEPSSSFDTMMSDIPAVAEDAATTDDDLLNSFVSQVTTFDAEDTESSSIDTEQSSLLSEMNDEGTFTSDVVIDEGSALDTADIDKNSFEGLFSGASTKPTASTGSKTSILESGACDMNAFELVYVNISNIIVWQPRIRHSSDITALTTSIKNDGLLQPLVVAPTKTEGHYVLIKGARRLMACAKLGMRQVPCVVNKQISNSDIHVVEPIYSHTKPYSVSDMLGYIDYLKKEKHIEAASMIEYLLNMNSGDYMKLMDVMDDNDEEIVGALLTGQLDIGSAYKKLEQKRKKSGKDKMATDRAEKIYGDTTKYGTDILADSGETGSGSDQLSEEELKEIVDGIGDLDNVDNLDGEELRKDGDTITGYQPHKQDPNDRERLDPKLRKAVLARDNNTCRICGMGGQEYPEVLDCHHILEVYLGGDDDINNLICACTVCHKLIHLWGRGELQVRPFEQMDEAEANKFKRIIKLGNAIREGMAAKGMKKEQLKKLDQADTIGRRLKGSSDQVAG